MLDYILAGIALGSIYAIAASGIVITYASSGVLNFAFGSLAYFLARFYYFLDTERGWDQIPAVIVAVFVAGPVLGAVLYLALFRHLRLATPLIRIVASIGVSVALPPAALMIFGNDTITSAPGLASAPVRAYKFFGATMDLNQVIALASVLTVLIVGTLVLQFTDVGLKVRAMVDTEALTSLSGVSPGKISICVWMVTTSLAGLAGVLVAPANGLTPGGMTQLLAAAFAAVVAARLRSLPAAVAVAMAMGVVTDVVQKYLPENSSLTHAVLVSIPIFVMGAFLLVYIRVSGKIDEESSTGGALDRAIQPVGGGDSSSASAAAAVVRSRTGWSWYLVGPVAIVGIVAFLPGTLNGYWLTLLAGGLAYSVILLSFTMTVGEGGMIWLCQASFAGCGAVVTAQFSTNHGIDPLLSVLLGALIAAPIGLVIGLLTIRLGNLYVALVTLTVGLLAEQLIFTRDIFFQDGLGVAADRPAFLSDDRSFAFLALAVFVVLSIIVVNLRRSTTGLALAAVRYSEPGARSVGLSVLGMKLLVSALGAFIAALGGGLLALNYGWARPTDFNTFGGLVWLAVLVTIGLRSITAALLAGLTFTLVPGIFTTYLSPSWGNIPTLLFGLGAIGVAVNPDGAVAQNARALQSLFAKVIGRLKRDTGAPTLPVPPKNSDAADGELVRVLEASR